MEAWNFRQHWEPDKLAGMMDNLIGIDIGGTKSAVCIGCGDGSITSRAAIPTTKSPYAMLDALADLAREMAKSEQIAGIGIVCGGPLDTKRGVVLSPPNLPGWDKIPVVEYLSTLLKAPAWLQNDANAGAMAEWIHGAGRGRRNMVFCTMGTGFGCGLILDGRLYEGTNGNAGELGHVRLSKSGPTGYCKEGSVEGWCSGAGIAQIAAERLKLSHSGGEKSLMLDMVNINAAAVAEAANRGDKLALKVYAEVGARLGEALAIIVDILNIEIVVIGSIFARCESLIRPAMEEVLARECLPGALAVCRVLPAELGERIGDVAALTVAQHGLLARA